MQVYSASFMGCYEIMPQTGSCLAGSVRSFREYAMSKLACCRHMALQAALHGITLVIAVLWAKPNTLPKCETAESTNT